MYYNPNTRLTTVKNESSKVDNDADDELADTGLEVPGLLNSATEGDGASCFTELITILLELEVPELEEKKT